MAPSKANNDGLPNMSDVFKSHPKPEVMQVCLADIVVSASMSSPVLILAMCLLWERTVIWD